MRVVVDGFGKYVGKEGNLVVVKERGKAVKKAKPSELKQLLISGRGAISTDAIELLLSHGVDVVFIDRLGRVRGRLMHPFVGTAKTRREQYAAYNDERGVLLAKEFASAKLRNQILVLTNLAKARKDSQPEVSQRLIQARSEVKAALGALASVSGERIEEVREEIMGIEGRASNAYWEALAMVFPREFQFRGRRGLEAGQTRHAKDMINAMLNYGYAILHSECIRAAELAGLDPYAGFLHCDRSGRTSIALDLMEEFRQQVVDRRIIKLVTYGQVEPEDCELRNFVCVLKDKARRRVLNEVLNRLEARTQYEGRNLSYSSIILEQARKITAYLRGERRHYTGFWQGW